MRPLVERLNHATSPPPPEYEQVRRMCAITLARIQAEGAKDDLAVHYRYRKPSPDDVPGWTVNNACGWALARLGGKPYPAPVTIRRDQRDWFLVPDK